MTAMTTERARWYPSLPPALDGEDAAAYTDRLTGADRTDRRPYDHPRNRGCSIGWHGDCTDLAGETCKCPCHDDRTWVVREGMAISPAIAAAAVKLAGLYGLPEMTGVRVMLAARYAAGDGVMPDRGVLADGLLIDYRSKQSDGFIADAANIYHAAVTGTLQ
jgi:hypothetical protein